MIATTNATMPAAGASRRCGVGDPRELARYTLSDGTVRLVVGQRINGVVRLLDLPADDHGRRYVIERELECDGLAALTSLINDYLCQAQRHDCIPVAENPVDRYLADLR